jgi:hypothetical protein
VRVRQSLLPIKGQATTVVKLKRPEPQAEPETNSLWNAERLNSRSEDGRRILFLELVAWAIYTAETVETRREWHAFMAQL